MQGFLYLDGLTVNLINQTKTIFTAICVYLLLGRRQSGLQCVALAMLFGASVLLALDKTPENKADALLDVDYNTWFFGGVLPVFAASMLSGIASALSQRSLQVKRRSQKLQRKGEGGGLPMPPRP
jgi:UDP-sugar transporter A1/2/3